MKVPIHIHEPGYSVKAFGGSQRIGILHNVLSIRNRGLFRCKLKRLECNAKHLRPSITKVKEEGKFRRCKKGKVYSRLHLYQYLNEDG